MGVSEGGANAEGFVLERELEENLWVLLRRNPKGDALKGIMRERFFMPEAEVLLEALRSRY